MSSDAIQEAYENEKQIKAYLDSTFQGDLHKTNRKLQSFREMLAAIDLGEA